MSKVTPYIDIIRAQLDAGTPAYLIAREYGVHPSVIENMQKGNTFRNTPNIED